MEHLNIVNLIQSATISVALLGAIILWKTYQYRGISMLLTLSALAALINILEESGLTRQFYLVSPVFIMLFAPVTFLATKFIITRRLNRYDWLHFLPVVPLLTLTSHVRLVIALGTAWRLVYALMTVSLLIKFKRMLDQNRSDSDELSLNWLAWAIMLVSIASLLDLIRLNSQHLITIELNILGQGINNSVWLIFVMFITVMLNKQNLLPNNEASILDNFHNTPIEQVQDNENLAQSYQSIFTELDKLISTNQWYLKPRLTLNDVSQLTGLQSRDISRAINLCHGRSFNEYINKYRVNYVCQLLNNASKQPLIDIALAAGFSSKAAFNVIFKQHTGKTPSEYKHQLNRLKS